MSEPQEKRCHHCGEPIYWGSRGYWVHADEMPWCNGYWGVRAAGPRPQR